ncbi:hypothetical protein G6L91_11485 [Agrobacterium rhizogenes]|uniref:hypothetical protein n=1 Tax=Rhizobium rhizogenes TaxID=359 RepID=UPI001571D338|nr:hypothetical protein [Rhizobium rhizogenes]NTF62089.1 hypothetical protein [Rhizobium rhizogenes]
MAARHDSDPKALLAARRREAAKPGRQKTSGRGSGLTPRVKQAIDLIVYGDDLGPATRQKEAAERVGMGISSLRAAMAKPAVDNYYRQQIALYRNGERAQSLRTLAEIRDDPVLKSNAAGATARIKAAERLAFDQPGQSQQVNVQVNSSVTVTPGYVIRIDRSKDERRQPVIAAEEDAKVFPVEEVLVPLPHPMRSIPEDF